MVVKVLAGKTSFSFMLLKEDNWRKKMCRNIFYGGTIIKYSSTPRIKLSRGEICKEALCRKQEEENIALSRLLSSSSQVMQKSD